MFGVQEDNYVVQSNRICFASMITTAKLDKDNHLSNLDNQEKYTNGNIALSDKEAMSGHLVSVAINRDKQSFKYLYKYYAPRVKSYLMRQGASSQSAEELSQEALMSVWRKADRFDPSKASAGTWIFTVARNLRIDALRKENRPQFDPHDPAFVPEQEIAPDANLSLSETRGIVGEAIKKLPSDQAEVIRLSFYSDKAHRDISEELNIPLGTVKSRMRLAMKKLTLLLGDRV